MKTTKKLLEEACIADGNVSTSKVFAEELQSCLENGEETLWNVLESLGLALLPKLSHAQRQFGQLYRL